MSFDTLVTLDLTTVSLRASNASIEHVQPLAESVAEAAVSSCVAANQPVQGDDPVATPRGLLPFMRYAPGNLSPVQTAQDPFNCGKERSIRDGTVDGDGRPHAPKRGVYNNLIEFTQSPRHAKSQFRLANPQTSSPCEQVRPVRQLQRLQPIESS